MEKRVLKGANWRSQCFEEEAFDQVLGGVYAGDYGRAIARLLKMFKLSRSHANLYCRALAGEGTSGRCTPGRGAAAVDSAGVTFG
jgi:hypothetical protein